MVRTVTRVHMAINVKHLGDRVLDNDRLTGAGHSKQYAMLRSVSQPGPDPDQIPSGSVVN